MDIIAKIKEKIIDRLLQIGLFLIGVLLTALAFLLDQIFEIQQTVSKLSPLLLLKIILLLSAVVIFLVAYILHKRPKYKFTRFNDLLWLHNDPIPFCLNCYEANNNAFHMFVKAQTDPPRYKCQHCGYYPKASKHPDEPKEINKITQPVNEGDGE